MAASGTNITKQSVINDYLSRINDPVVNSIVFSSNNNPGETRIEIAELGPAAFSVPNTANITDTIVTASTIVAQVKSFVFNTTAARRARSGYITDDFNPDSAEVTTDDRTDICRLKDNYRLTYNYDSSTINSNTVISGPGLQSFMDAIRSTASAAQTSAEIIDLRVCHSSCHTSCHGSRGRR